MGEIATQRTPFSVFRGGQYDNINRGYRRVTRNFHAFNQPTVRQTTVEAAGVMAHVI